MLYLMLYVHVGVNIYIIANIYVLVNIHVVAYLHLMVNIVAYLVVQVMVQVMVYLVLCTFLHSQAEGGEKQLEEAQEEREQVNEVPPFKNGRHVAAHGTAPPFLLTPPSKGPLN